MKKIISKKIFIVVIALSLMVLLTLLAVSLRDLRFIPPRVLNQDEGQGIHISVENIVAEIVNIPFWKQVLFWISAFIIVFLITRLFSPELRRIILKYFLRLAIFILVLFYLFKNYGWLLPNLSFTVESLPDIASGTPLDTSPPEFAAPQVQPPVLYIVSLLIVLVIVAGISFLIFRYIQKKRLEKKPGILNDIAKVARTSLKKMSTGNDWEDSIIQCYAHMNEAISLQQGVNRPLDFTPSEFAEKLVAIGLPPLPVNRLTKLFESVRYGARLASDKDRKDATACLNEIITICEALN